MPDIGTVVKLLIEASGGDYQAAARAIGRSPQALSGKIKNRRRFTPDELSRLARYFGVKPGVFFVPPMEFFHVLGETSARYLDGAGPEPYLRSLPAPDLSLPEQLPLSFLPGLSSLPGHLSDPEASRAALYVGGGREGVGVRSVAAGPA